MFYHNKKAKMLNIKSKLEIQWNIGKKKKKLYLLVIEYFKKWKERKRFQFKFDPIMKRKFSFFLYKEKGNQENCDYYCY